MATPATLKKLDDKKAAAQKRREKLEQDQLLPLTGNAPSAHLLISGNPNPAPRMMDLRPLSRPVQGGRPFEVFTQYRMSGAAQQQQQFDINDDFASDHFSSGIYTSFEGSNQQQKQQKQQQQMPSMNPQMMGAMHGFGQMNQPRTMFNAYSGGGAPRKAFGGYKLKKDGGKLPPPKLKPQEVTAPPESMEGVEYTLRANNLVCFHGKEHFLSTMYPDTILVDGHEYPSVEHYYQACKLFSLLGSEHAQQLRYVQDPFKAKSKAREMLAAFGVPNYQVDQWKKTHGLLVLLHGIRHKFKQSTELRQKLLGTGEALLCQAYDRDSLYAVGQNEQQLREWAKENEGKVLKFPVNLTEEKIAYLPMLGKGKNVLGVICMQIRKELAAPEQAEEEEEEKSQESDEDLEQDTSEQEEEEQEEDEKQEEEEDNDGKELTDRINAVLGFGQEEEKEEEELGKENQKQQQEGKGQN